MRQTVAVVDQNTYCADEGASGWLSHEDGRFNLDAPKSIDMMRFVDTLWEAKHAHRGIRPSYDFEIDTRFSMDHTVRQMEIVIAEGSLVFMDDEVRGLFDLRIFIDTPPDVRLRRRLERDVREKGCPFAEAIEHYLAYVLPIHDRWIEPANRHSDLVISGCDPDVSFHDLVTVIWRRMQAKEAVGRSRSIH